MSHPHRITPFEDLPSKSSGLPKPRSTAILTENAEEGNPFPNDEIKGLIEELQRTNREVRSALRNAEGERDAVSVRLAEALSQIDQLRANERELRSQFIEVTSLIKERDAAVSDARKISQAARQIQQQLEDALRSRADLERQREEASRRIESLRRTAEEAASHVSEAQRQVLAVRQARDAAHAQNLELSEKLARAQDRISDLEYERESAGRDSEQSAAELAEYRRQFETQSSDREAAASQIAQLTSELDALRQRLLDLSDEKAAVVHADAEHTTALSEARMQVASLAAERDNARNRAQEQALELEEMRRQFEQLRDERRKQSDGELFGAREKMALIENQLRETRHEAATLRQQLQTATGALAALEQDASSTLTAEKAAALVQERESALSSLTTLQLTVDRLTAERDQALARASGAAVQEAEEMLVLRARVMALESIEQEARANAEEAREIAARFERQRVETIDIATQLQAAQREIRELSATLAEARLQVKFAQASSAAAYASGAKMKEIVSTLAQPPIETVDGADGPAIVVPRNGVALDDREIRSALGAMRQCFHSFTKRSEDLSLLDELFCHLRGFADRAQSADLAPVHRLSGAFAEFTQSLYKNPALLNPSTLRSMSQTIEFLAQLMREPNLGSLSDPAESVIYAVEDDPDNCETIRLAMDTAGMRTECALEPHIALTELPGRKFDLIFLDVNMPVMDGFELCAHIRQIKEYATTPVVFVTGLATLENRVKSSLSGGNDFIAKPFNTFELPVKALTHILRRQLGPG